MGWGYLLLRDMIEIAFGAPPSTYGVKQFNCFKVILENTHTHTHTQELMSAVSSRIPTSVEDAIQKSLARYASNITSVVNQFPSVQIVNIINRHAASIPKRSDHDQFFMNTSPIVQLVQK